MSLGNPRAFLRKKKADTRSAKVHVGFSCSGRETVRRLNDFQMFSSFLWLLLNRKLDRDNRSLLFYLSPWTIVAMEDE
ncbi:hypothetical protein D0N43_20490 [Klebsiella aerogenes]|nr:hypothetical protein CRN78_01495 [Klebsiella aerogenes]AUZ16891.1 hypothetical protein AL511_25805 [Klebsiella aerogenes]OQR42818.1 hypothetical protein BW261_23320 [Klebsiella aerogenes]QDK13404.1 hypothetical protein ES159_07360 [Klebsiella aerogenes]RFP71867.1 hypothetical protein D0N43_20490 [Klebsiella aerogenes]